MLGFDRWFLPVRTCTPGKGEGRDRSDFYNMQEGGEPTPFITLLFGKAIEPMDLK